MTACSSGTFSDDFPFERVRRWTERQPENPPEHEECDCGGPSGHVRYGILCRLEPPKKAATAEE